MFSQAFAPLLAGRMLQGAGVGASPVAAFSIAASLFEDPDRGKAVGVISAVLAILSGSGSADRRAAHGRAVIGAR